MEKKQAVFGTAIYIKAQKTPSAYSSYDPAPLFRKEFTVEEEIIEARILVQSPGFARYFINGRDITDDLFISAVSDYNKILWYNEYDVTPLLRRGRNAIGVIAGNGYLNESFRTAWDFDRAPWRDAPQFLLQLSVNGRETLVSDGSWRCSREHSPILYNHLRSGEYWDMRKCGGAWLQVGYDDSDWQPVVKRTAPVTGELRPTRCQPIRECERIAPKSIRQTPRGYLVDFGVNLSGYAEVTLREARGTEILFRYAEEIDGQDEPKHNGMNNPHFYPESPFQVNRMIASGDRDTFKPMFSYHGFRYLLIEGLTAAPEPSQLSAHFTHQDIARRSRFSSGNEVLNFIYDAGIRSTYSNLFWCLTDCPTREKMGWMNDAQASMEQVLIDFDILPLLEKWYADILVSLFEDGSLHGTIPAPDWPWGHACGPVCDCMLFELPYRVYLYTGREDLLISGIPCFERYIGFLEKKVAEGHEFILGDWAGNVKEVPKAFIAEMYLLKAYDVTAMAHRLAGDGDDKWERRRAAWRTTLAARYTDGEGRCTVDSQTAIAMLLQMQVGEHAEVLARQLISRVERDGCQLKSGMVGIQYIYDALWQSGRGDLAYRLLTESTPGYRSWMEKGATTLWEYWDGEDRGSHNHHMYSGVISRFFRCLLGITPLERAPGFSEIELHPTLISSLGHAEGSMETVRGRIDVAWYKEADGFRYTVTLPDSIAASFRGQRLKTGKNEFWITQEATL